MRRDMYTSSALGLGFCCVTFLVGLSPAAAQSNPTEGRADIVIADFEGKDYGNWKAEGEAFGPGPAQGTLPGQMPVAGFLGKGLVNSFHKGDDSTGRLTSPPLKIERKFINFLIGGGMHPGQTCINLLVDGKCVRTATGPNGAPGGSEALDWASWDVTDLVGKTALIEIVDQQKGGWGHINIDQIVQSDAKKDAFVRDPQREITLESKYLLFPVKNGSQKRIVKFLLDGKVEREFDIELAESENDFWVFLDVSAFRGRKATVQLDRMAEGSPMLKNVEQGDAIKGAENLYQEKYRPQFHFSSRRGWLNDPNGLVFSQGEYHLYYQHNPYGREWGNMHWGHAVSKDLVHWQELPIAIYPHRFGDWAFSGSAIVDKDNTAGFKTGKEDVIVAAYTSTGRGECIVFSNDRGRTFQEYQGNPAVKHSGRDPKLIWYAPGKHWVMAVYDEFEGKQWIALHTSPDLKNWTLQSRVEGYFECPEIFEIALDGKKDDTRWIIYAADGAYTIGRFDGKTFTRESGKHRYNFGDSFYASQTFNNIPSEDGRRIQIGWSNAGHGSMPFNQMMDFPTQLTLRTTSEGPRLFAQPVKEIESIHGKSHAWKDRPIAPGATPLEGVKGELLEIRAEIALGQAEAVGFHVRGVPIVYDVKKQTLAGPGFDAPLAPIDGKIRLQILVDRVSVEIFANDGRVYVPTKTIPKTEDQSVASFARGEGAKIGDLKVFELKSAW